MLLKRNLKHREQICLDIKLRKVQKKPKMFKKIIVGLPVKYDNVR